MSHVPHSAAFGLDQTAGGSRRAPAPKAGLRPVRRPGLVDCVFSCIVLASGGYFFVVKASAAARE